ncbi:MAG: hypothetical protein J6K26_10215 [Lachnospiraceae bacterium]|nr:hypothetical protein [Lachnospiraceae bacterium]
MKDNKQLKALKQRDKIFNLLFYLVLLAPVLYFAFQTFLDIYVCYLPLSDQRLSEMIHYSYSLCSFFEDFCIPIFLFSLITMQLIRWWNYERDSLRYANLSLPVTKKNKLTYDLQTGFRAIITVHILYGCLLLLSLLTEYLLVRNMEVSLCSISLEQGIIINELWYFLLAVINSMIGSAIIYTTLVFGKIVARTILWGFLFFLSGSFCYIFISDYSWELLWNISRLDSRINFWTPDERILHYDYINLMYFAKTLLLMVVILVLLLFVIYQVSKRVDEAKGGAYYFKWVQLFVCVMLSLFFFIPVITAPTEYMSLGKPLYILLTCLFTAGIFSGIFYLTNPKRK